MKKFLCAFLIASFSALPLSWSFTLNSSTNPNLKGWADPDIKLMVNTANCPAGVDVASIISEAAEVWNNVPTSIMTVAYGGTTSSTSMSFPVTVYCEVNFQANLGMDQNSVPGAAAVDGSSGQITRGVLYLNASTGTGNIGNFDREILKVILAHEIGHILGLGHSGDTKALMYYDASAKTTLGLAQDDMDGIAYLYPSDEFSDGKYAGCGTVANLPPPSSGVMLLALCSLLLPVSLILGIKQFAPRFS